MATILLAPIRIYQASVSGTINGINKTFSSPEVFDMESIVVFLNGVRQHRGINSDYDVAESVVGLGFDLIVFGKAPKAGDQIAIDYTKG